MTDIPNTRLYNLVDQPANIQYLESGEAFVFLDPTNPTSSNIDITGFRQISIQIGATQAKGFDLFIGKISNSTLSQRISRAVDNTIHTFNCVGPEMGLILTNGPPNSTEQVQLWVYLRS